MKQKPKIIKVWASFIGEKLYDINVNRDYVDICCTSGDCAKIYRVEIHLPKPLRRKRTKSKR